MAKKQLNAEEIAELRDCPFVASIISGRITFTPEFKRMAYRQLMDGKSMRSIFEENGIDPDILGDSRIWGFAQKLRTNADRDGDLKTCAARTRGSRPRRAGRHPSRSASNSWSTSSRTHGRRWNS